MSILLAAAALFLLTSLVLYQIAPDMSVGAALRHTKHRVRARAKAYVDHKPAATAIPAEADAAHLHAAAADANSAAASEAAFSPPSASANSDLAAARVGVASALDDGAKPSDKAAAGGDGAKKTAATSFRRINRRGAAARERALADCFDQQSACATWSQAGECEKNPGYMRPNCPKSCNACLDKAKKRTLCHRTRRRRPLLTAGGVDGTFQRIIAMYSPTHEVSVLSQPPKGPWVVTIDGFLQEHEIRAMMEKGGHHFERSLAGEGVSPVRTSKTSWCNVPFCEGDPVVRSIKRRVANATGVPLANSEHVQVLQYDPGDFYRQHHDQNANPHSPWGPRLFTFFLYLNDLDAKDGGGTRFPYLNMTVAARRGRALFWPSVLNSDPSAVRTTNDQRTTHEALTVTRGKKFAANMWLHQFDFQSPLAAGCKNEDQAEWRPTDPLKADLHPSVDDEDGHAGGDDEDEGVDDSGPLGRLGPGGWIVGGTDDASS